MVKIIFPDMHIKHLLEYHSKFLVLKATKTILLLNESSTNLYSKTRAETLKGIYSFIEACKLIMPAATFAQKIIFAVKIREYTKKALSGSFLWSPFLLS